MQVTLYLEHPSYGTVITWYRNSLQNVAESLYDVYADVSSMNIFISLYPIPMPARTGLVVLGVYCFMQLLSSLIVHCI